MCYDDILSCAFFRNLFYFSKQYLQTTTKRKRSIFRNNKIVNTENYFLFLFLIIIIWIKNSQNRGNFLSYNENRYP